MILIKTGSLSVRLVNPCWPGVWKQVAPYLEMAIDLTCSADLDISTIYDGSMSGRFTTWGLFKEEELFGAVTMEQLVYPKRKIMRLLLVGLSDDMQVEWDALFVEYLNWLKQHGFAALEGGGRKGWLRRLNGYKITPKYSFEIDLWA